MSTDWLRMQVFRYKVPGFADDVVWNVNEALAQVAAGHIRGTVEVEEAEMRGIISNNTFDEAHVADVDPTIPGIAAPLRYLSGHGAATYQGTNATHGQTIFILIDGIHRTARNVREGTRMKAHILTDDAARAALLAGPPQLMPWIPLTPVVPQTVEIPKRLANRPRFHGMPIPFFATFRVNGSPDFKVVDEEHRAICLTQERCWVCGEPHDYYKFFIGGPLCLSHMHFYDPPSHEECARYAIQVCPFLATPGYEYAENYRPDLHPDGFLTERVPCYPERPDQMFLVKTRNYKLVTVQNTVLAKVSGPFILEEFA